MLQEPGVEHGKSNSSMESAWRGECFNRHTVRRSIWREPFAGFASNAGSNCVNSLRRADAGRRQTVTARVAVAEGGRARGGILNPRQARSRVNIERMGSATRIM